MEVRCLVFTWSENPYEDMWNHLLFLAKKNNAKKLLSGSISSGRTVIYKQRSILEKKANQVSFGISQSFEYFHAADSVSITTSPLLYFYGMLSLAKSLIVANRKKVFLEDIDYHGLARRPKDKTIAAYDSKPKSWEIEKEYAVSRASGVFPHFTDVISDFQYPNGAVFALKDTLAVCPEISQFFEKYYGKASKTLYLYQFQIISEDLYKIEICPSERDEKEIYKRIPQLGKDFDLYPELLHNKARIFTSRNMTEFPDYLGLHYPVVGGKYIVGGLNYRVGSNNYYRYIDPLVVDYIAMFILSTCVRYKQDLWGETIQGRKSGVLGLIELYISIIKRRFPNLILNHIVGQKFDYGSPARLM